ncbi:MAG: molybdopterin oxidoreductase [Gammaproteobacteria bacterium]|jgi:molybdopterin-containing oxidoreductase family membrane subunit|nr:molybdopterin oxidoreductase [Gammaproteobacteria bacterium]
MPAATQYSEIKTHSSSYWALLVLLAAGVLIGVAGAHHMDVEGHHVSGMNNQIVWGLPHVFAIFLIVAASGALNIASLASVFAKQAYKPLARFSAILSVALLVGGLAILLLDLGRPDRLIVAMTYYNFKSIFAWNIILYSGFVVIVLAYLWLMMERRMQRWSKPAGLLAFVWRLVLTTGTGSIFGFLVARESYDTALLAPMFIIMSFAFGLATLILLLMLSFSLDRRELDVSHLLRLRRLLGIFTASVFYFVVVFHLTKLYGTQNHGFEAFILMDGGIYTSLFWIAQIGLGNLLPLALIYAPSLQQSSNSLVLACLLVIAGAFAQLYIIIVGGQAYPLNIFPGYVVESGFYDGVVGEYAPSLWEFMLGFGGLTAALLIALLVLRVLPIMPTALGAEGK